MNLDDFLALPEAEQRKRLLLAPFYADVRNEIVTPDRVTLQSRYFWERWARILGPRDTVLLLRLRQLCYFNRDTGERRDWCFPSHEGIGAELGLERKAVLRGLARLEGLGLIRREAQYRYDPELHKRVRSSDRYLVQMEDPLVPDDVPRAFVLAAERLVNGDPFDEGGAPRGRELPHAPFPGGVGAPPKSQNGTLVNTSSPKSQKGTGLAVPKRDRKRYLEGVLKRLNVVACPSERSEDLALELATQLHDHRSLRFYRIVAAAVPESLVRRALSEARSAAAEGRIRRSAGAYFTAALRAMAGDVGGEAAGDRVPSGPACKQTTAAPLGGMRAGETSPPMSPALDDAGLARFLGELERFRRRA